MVTQAIVRTPGPDAASGLTTADLGKPDHALLLEQHAAYVQTLTELGLTITHLPPLPGHPDAYFVEDTALMFSDCAILTRPGAPARRAEAEAMTETLAKFRPLHRLTAPATLDGGDVLVIDRKVFVGLSERTNAEGATQLRKFLPGYLVLPVRVPSGLHLKSSVTDAGDNHLLITRELSTRPEFATHRRIVVPDEETYAANILCLNGVLVMPSGFPKTQALLEKRQLPMRVLDQSEARKMDGALTCMSLRF